MRSETSEQAVKFAVDCMLGKLAKWLRILGFDAVFFSRIEDDDLLAVARDEERILLSRDHELIGRTQGIPSTHVVSENWPEQVCQVMDFYSLWDRVRPYSRCSACNRELKSLPRSRAKNLVAPFIFVNAGHFALCPGCGRIYWEGTHRRDMEVRLAALRLGRDPEQGPRS